MHGWSSSPHRHLRRERRYDRVRFLDRAIHGIAAGPDRFVHRLILNASRSRRGLETTLGPGERVDGLRRLLETLEHPRFIANDEEFFADVDVPQVEIRATPRPGVDDLRFGSEHLHQRAIFPEVRHVWERIPKNDHVIARRFRASDPELISAVPSGGGGRPALILLHGFYLGNLRFEERVWPIPWFLRQGVDVVIAVLPFHGARRDSGEPLPFPGNDPRVTIEGFRQCVADLRGLVRWLRADGASAVGMMGMSLGGYTTALLATVEPLEFAVPFIPLASLADFARDGGRLIGTKSQREEQYELLEAVYSVVSPLARPPRVAPAGRLVLAGRADGITPVSHARRIADHFDAPLEIFRGGHLLQFGRSDAFRAVGRMLGQLGLLGPRKPR